MKLFFKRLSIFILIIILLLGWIVGYFYMQSKAYINETNIDRQIAISRSIKTSLRTKLNQTANASLTQILQAGYNTLHRYNNKRIQNSHKTMREHSIQHTNIIIDIVIHIPSMIANELKPSAKEENTLAFYYKEQFLWSITIHTQEERDVIEENGALNEEKIAEQEWYILTYTQTLDNPFKDIELEAFGEIAHAFNRAIDTTEILHITHRETIIGYVQDIDTENLSMYVSPVTLFTGEQAAIAIAEHDPALCESILSETEQELCIPPNNTYILRGDSIQIAFIADEGLQTSITVREDNDTWKIIDIQTFITDREEKYQETIFSIDFIAEGALSLQEQTLR